MKAVGEPDAGNPQVRFDEGLLGNARGLLYPEVTPVEIRALPAMATPVAEAGSPLL